MTIGPSVAICSSYRNVIRNIFVVANIQRGKGGNGEKTEKYLKIAYAFLKDKHKALVCLL